MTYQLNVQTIQDVCLFELTWGRGQRLQAQVPYPAQLQTRYQQWQRAYLNFYQKALRGRVGAVGQVAMTTSDLHSQLVQTEARLLSEFHRWLRQGDLIDIRKTLSLAAREASIDLFLSCTPLEIARLPWETWEIGAEFGGESIHIVRSPSNLRVAPKAPAQRRSKPRVLAILGDDLQSSNGLNIAHDYNTLKALDPTFIVWTPGQDPVAFKAAICRAIADPQGWDVLFFAGHSNEAEDVDGHIYVAPKTALSIWELQPYLQTAQENGLQFAFFNSCSGLTIADALIEMGFSQVAIMREPIHDQVAQQLLVQFLHSLVAHQDAQASLQAACRHLKLEQHLTYPSAYLVPSLFRHPDSVPYRIPTQGWRSHLQQWLPSSRQAIALGAVALLSVIPGVQEALLSSRLVTQSIYRNVTGQLPSASPDVVLVQIDDASIRDSPLLNLPTPISRTYLADLLRALDRQGASTIGIDYVLDRQHQQSPNLAAAVRQMVDQSETWLIFSAILEGGEEVGVNPDSGIRDPAWALQGYTNAPKWYMALPWQGCAETCPFPYLLAIGAQHHAEGTAPRPRLDRRPPLRPALVRAIGNSNHPDHQRLADYRMSGMTVLGDRLGQRWLRPILDFSLPPNRVFHRVSAHELLGKSVSSEISDAIEQSAVVIIGGVGYAEGNVEPLSSDISPTPPAIAYWRQSQHDDSHERTFAGVEAIAYDVHHYLHGHTVTPIPALWMVGVAAMIAPAIALYGLPKLKDRRRGILVLTGITVGYGWISVQAMIFTGVMMPWLLPSAVIWIYGLPSVWRLSES